MTTIKDEHLYFIGRFFNSVLSSLSQGVDPSHFIIKRNQARLGLIHRPDCMRPTFAVFLLCCLVLFHSNFFTCIYLHNTFVVVEYCTTGAVF